MLTVPLPDKASGVPNDAFLKYSNRMVHGSQQALAPLHQSRRVSQASLRQRSKSVGDRGLEPLTSCVSSIPLIKNPCVFC